MRPRRGPWSWSSQSGACSPSTAQAPVSRRTSDSPRRCSGSSVDLVRASLPARPPFGLPSILEVCWSIPVPRRRRRSSSARGASPLAPDDRAASNGERDRGDRAIDKPRARLGGREVPLVRLLHVTEGPAAQIPTWRPIPRRMRSHGSTSSCSSRASSLPVTSTSSSSPTPRRWAGSVAGRSTGCR